MVLLLIIIMMISASDGTKNPTLLASAAFACWHRERVDCLPHLHDAHSRLGQHAVLQTVQDLAVDGRHKLACHEAYEDAARDIVLFQALEHLVVLVEHGPVCKGYGLNSQC